MLLLPGYVFINVIYKKNVVIIIEKWSIPWADVQIQDALIIYSIEKRTEWNDSFFFLLVNEQYFWIPFGLT